MGRGRSAASGGSSTSARRSPRFVTRDPGINFFDTAQAYGFGDSERLLGEALRDDLDHRRDEVVIATKGGLRDDDERPRDSSPEWLRRGVDESLRALGVEHIDLYQVHWPDPHTPFGETAGALTELVGEGKIRHVGVSNYDADQVTEFARTRPLAHGLLTGAMDEHTKFGAGDWRGISPQFEGEAFRRNLEVVGELERFAADELGCPVGRLAIAWVLANPAVHVAIVGSRRASHIEDSVGALEVELTGDHLARLDEITSSAVEAGGPYPEMAG